MREENSADESQKREERQKRRRRDQGQDRGPCDYLPTSACAKLYQSSKPDFSWSTIISQLWADNYLHTKSDINQLLCAGLV